MRIDIIGGGIGGLTTALALRQFGFEPDVFEPRCWLDVLTNMDQVHTPLMQQHAQQFRSRFASSRACALRAQALSPDTRELMASSGNGRIAWLWSCVS
jgi:2-polyprenyl-6-methoxyphenol hydroxylase-like FAD-dependent oxidoreductase